MVDTGLQQMSVFARNFIIAYFTIISPTIGMNVADTITIIKNTTQTLSDDSVSAEAVNRQAV